MIQIGVMASQISGHLSNPAFESISTVSVGAGGSSSISFTSIPSTYKHLQIRGIQRSDQVGTQDTNIRFNNDTAANYSWHRLFADGGGTASASATSSASTMNYGAALGTGTLANSFPTFIIDVLDYQNTNKYKTFRELTGFDTNGGGYIYLYSGNWRSTSAVNRIDLYPGAGSFAQYSHFALYGVEG